MADMGRLNFSSQSALFVDNPPLLNKLPERIAYRLLRHKGNAVLWSFLFMLGKGFCLSERDSCTISTVDCAIRTGQGSCDSCGSSLI